MGLGLVDGSAEPSGLSFAWKAQAQPPCPWKPHCPPEWGPPGPPFLHPSSWCPNTGWRLAEGLVPGSLHSYTTSVWMTLVIVPLPSNHWSNGPSLGQTPRSGMSPSKNMSISEALVRYVLTSGFLKSWIQFTFNQFIVDSGGGGEGRFQFALRPNTF